MNRGENNALGLVDIGGVGRAWSGVRTIVAGIRAHYTDGAHRGRARVDLSQSVSKIPKHLSGPRCHTDRAVGVRAIPRTHVAGMVASIRLRIPNRRPTPGGVFFGWFKSEMLDRLCII